MRLGCREASVVVLAADHRRLLVRSAAPAFEIVVFVDDAPNALNEEALYDWWEVTESPRDSDGQGRSLRCDG